MKRRDLEERLRQLGWVLERHGARHDVWSRGERRESVPRHREVSERLARAILARAAQRDAK
jgi:mRNA interferase HicA